ncbi:hypothetical protein AAJ76_4400024885 [Vairimorpha ceranae]|uniref:Uncharacterized protein n=1 Tax=Vairimorpha ceranae TaxID=40302 RepID=A0A0F9WDB3_9MICR|nr:hypothetical protein AAJ76_4400024885 [Vairimorpha ceranae]KKO74810.1 hypothetical protein AAJ76_4400024885 [Vairimorpha ceranae]
MMMMVCSTMSISRNTKLKYVFYVNSVSIKRRVYRCGFNKINIMISF